MQSATARIFKAQAHELRAAGRWQVANRTAVVEQAVAPYPAELFELSGSSALLPPRAVGTISLAPHELGTNAAQCGAISKPSGRVAITWKHVPETGSLGLRWTAIGGAHVTTLAPKGLGSRMIDRLLAVELNGSTTIACGPPDVQCEIEAVLPPYTKA